MMNEKRDDKKGYLFLSVTGRDRPGIVASVVQVLYQNRYNIEALSQTVIMGQFAMILIASATNGEKADLLKQDCVLLMKDQGLEIHLKKIRPEEMVPYQAGETEPFVITVQGEDRPGLAYGISEILSEWGINITNLDARVAYIDQKLKYIQIYEVDIPRGLDFRIIHEKLRERGDQMRVSIDLQHRGIFRAINQI
jgi:glycine cleavage system transcriptional repressor